MHVNKEGSGPNVYLGIHGWAGNHRTFRRLMPYRPEDATFYSVDLPGYGASPPPAAWTFDSVAQELCDWIDGLDLHALAIVGNCGGALFAIEIAERRLERVRRVVLIDPFAYAPWFFRVFTWGAFGKHAYFSTFANPIGRWMTNNVLRRKRSRDTNLTAAFTSVNHSVAHRYICILCGLRNIERFRGLLVPADIVYGERTFAAVRRSLPLWKATLPRAAFHELKGAGHEPIREATEHLARIVFAQYERVQTETDEAESAAP